MMNNKTSCVTKLLISMVFLLAACDSQLAPEPNSTKSETVTSVPPTATPTLTPTPIPIPTDTPTITPTPLGGRNTLLLFDNFWQQDPVTKQLVVRNQKIYVYDVNSHKIDLFLEGFTPVGVSPDGNKVALLKTSNEKKDLFVVDLERPDQPFLLNEDVEDAIWSQGSEQIGFIALTNGVRQVFIIHPDGSDLTQVTNSARGVTTLVAAFNDRVFWGEGTVGNDGFRTTYDYKSTTLDGDETAYSVYIDSVDPNGNFVLVRPIRGRDPNHNVTFIDVTSSEERDIAMPVFGGKVQPITDDKWLLYYEPDDYLISSNGTVLLNFADLPHYHDPVPENPRKVDHYWTLSNTLQQPLSPDGNLLLLEHFVVFSRNPLDYEASYFVLNLFTLEIKELPGLSFKSKNGKVANNGRFIDGVVDGFRISQAFWVEMP